MYDWDKNKRETFIRKEIKLQCDMLLMVLYTHSHLLMHSDSYKEISGAFWPVFQLPFKILFLQPIIFLFWKMKEGGPF